MTKRENIGYVSAINGGVLEVTFPHELPAINNELKIGNLVAEVQGYIDRQTVRAVVMGPTQGLSRFAEVIDSGHPIEVPVGDEVLGRMFNVFGQPIDRGAPLKVKQKKSIHAKA